MLCFVCFDYRIGKNTEKWPQNGNFEAKYRIFSVFYNSKKYFKKRQKKLKNWHALRQNIRFFAYFGNKMPYKKASQTISDRIILKTVIFSDPKRPEFDLIFAFLTKLPSKGQLNLKRDVGEDFFVCFYRSFGLFDRP